MLLNFQHTDSDVFPDTFPPVQGVYLCLYTVDSLFIFLTLAFLIMYGTTL